ncbi:hypothetical protein ABEB36_005617 [Hypothenemus hampei]|uniref:C2H2-type domain-containing protein n=1 Tax=Hypothenemus hampei TaxID=57062 RepID=A0ABD1EZ98_HYPHA
MTSTCLVGNLSDKDLTNNEENISKSECFSENSNQWNTYKDTNDNLNVNDTEKDIIEKVCRTCFNSIDTDSYILVGKSEPDSYWENVIRMCLPNVNLLLIRDPVVCQKCLEILEEFYRFMIVCMTTENKLQTYYDTSQASGPIKMSEFINQSIKENATLMTIKQEEISLMTDITVEDVKDNKEEKLYDALDVKSEKDELDSSGSNIPIRERKRSEKTNLVCKDTRLKRKKFVSTDLLNSVAECDVCKKKFTSKWALSRHTPVHNTKDSLYFCDFCDLKFKYKHSFHKHMETHFKDVPLSKPFACECGKFFNRKSKLKKHQEIHIKKEKPFACKNCGKRFLDQILLDSHVERVHIQEKAFGCEVCRNKYTSKAGLDVHLKSHFLSDKPKPEPDLMCDICGKLFYRKYSLEKHRMSHTGDKPHECIQCGMKFKERYQLTIHFRKHTGEKPYECEVCGFKFSCKNRLAVHMRKHTGVRPFSCQLCDMAFTRNDHLIKHVRAIHTGERPFECDICQKTFNRKDYLLKHKKVHLKN